MNDELLYHKIKNGDKESFEILFRRYYESLLRFIWGYVKSEAIAEELIQEIFLKLWKTRQRLNIRSSVKAYLFRSARNLSIDYVRHYDVEQSWAEEKKDLHNIDDQSAIDDRLNDRLILDEIKKAILALPERRREIFMLSRYEGMSYREIADLLDISVSTVETQISRSLKTLKSIFEPYLTCMCIVFLTFLFV